MVHVSLLSKMMALLDNHPRLARLCLSPIARAPILAGRLPVLARAFMGCSAFEIHDVDLERGRIGIGGVDEIMWSSKFLELYHHILGEKMGEEEKNKALYAVGHGGGYWEIDEAIRHGRWAPARLVEMIDRGNTLEVLRTDPKMARFFELAMKMALRLIINEGGWGSPQMDLNSSPIQVHLAHSQEARWLGPSKKPVCYLSAGVIAGYSSRLLGHRVDAREVECMAMGAPRCRFTIE